MIVSVKPFCSNCLFQALKHKFGNWKLVKIRALFYWKGGLPHLHWYWQKDGYDFHFLSLDGRWKGKLFFKGQIHRHGGGFLKKAIKKSGYSLRDIL